MTKSFVLKKGYCHIDDDLLTISKSEKPGGVENPKVNFFMVFFGIMLILTIVYAVRNFVRGSVVLTAAYGVAASIIALNIALNWNKSSDTVINRSDIKSIEYKPAGTLTSDFFIVKYIVKGKSKQRVLMLARSKGNNKEVSKAKKYLSSIIELT